MIGLVFSTLVTTLCYLGADAVPGAWALVVRSGFWLGLCLSIHYALRVLLWDGLVPRMTGIPMPRLLVQLAGALFTLTGICIVLVVVFGVPLSGVLTTSSVFIAIVGFALRNMISDLFTGIALGIERPFSIGDWLQVADGTVGRVTEMNWRSTRLLTREEISVILPNSQLATSTFKNYSKPERAWRDQFDILLGKEVTAWQAERVLLSAVEQIPEIAQVGKPAEVRIEAFNEHGTLWQVRYWVPDYDQMSRLRYRVQKAVVRNMHYAGLSVPSEQLQLQQHGPADGALHRFLAGVDIFRELSESELLQLQESMVERLVLTGDEVVRQGDDGHSLFVLKEGLMEVAIDAGDGPLTVAHLVPGSFFGELSLLTGAPRGATVTARIDSVLFEIDKQAMQRIMQARPGIAESLGRIIAERARHNSAQREADRVEDEPDSSSIADRILTFFNIRDPSRVTSFKS
ncbi:MAG: mechanosensitive ion channel family protein [Pseudomonadales bacterium]|jgi:small-conductance mechanosensitive channel|nr:mechanosensitive ion channel family protein [Pseudomonadales bacterium]